MDIDRTSLETEFVSFYRDNDTDYFQLRPVKDWHSDTFFFTKEVKEKKDFGFLLALRLNNIFKDMNKRKVDE